MSNWQPIETAPKDGTFIQVWIVFDNQGRWEPYSCYEGGYWYILSSVGLWEHLEEGEEITHWMPPPEPPKDE